MKAYCHYCGHEVYEGMVLCPYCKSDIRMDILKEKYADKLEEQFDFDNVDVSNKDFLVTILLVACLGFLGFHRFYTGRIGTGIVWLITLGCGGVGWIVDLVLISCGLYKDKDNAYIRTNDYKHKQGIKTYRDMYLENMVQLETNS